MRPLLVTAFVLLAACQPRNGQQSLSEPDATCDAEAGPPGTAAHRHCRAWLRQREADEQRALQNRMERRHGVGI